MVVVCYLFQCVGKQVVDLNVRLANARGSEHNLTALVSVGERADFLEVEEIGAGFFARVDVQGVELYFAFFLKDKRQDFAVGMPGQEWKRGVDILIGVIASREKLLSFAGLQVFKP